MIKSQQNEQLKNIQVLLESIKERLDRETQIHAQMAQSIKNIQQEVVNLIKSDSSTPIPKLFPIPKQKIGEIAQTKLWRLLEQKVWSEQELANFFDKRYSKIIFGISHPLLSYDRLDDRGFARYYKHYIFVNSTKCYLCSQWFESSRQQLLDFIANYH